MNKKILPLIFTLTIADVLVTISHFPSYLGVASVGSLLLRVCLNFKLLKTKHLALGLEDEVWKYWNIEGLQGPSNIPSRENCRDHHSK